MSLEKRKAELDAADEMARLLLEVVEECTQQVNALALQVDSAKSLDKYTANRRRLILNTVLNVMLAAAYCIPIGGAVAGLVDAFRNKVIAAAEAVARQIPIDDVFMDAGTFVAKVGRQMANVVNDAINPDLKEMMSTGFDAISECEVNEDAEEKFDDLKKEFEEYKDEAVTFDSANSELPPAMVDAVQTTYRRLLIQLKQISLAGPHAHTSYVLSQLMANVELSNKGAQIAKLGGFKTGHEGRKRLALGKAEVDRAKKEPEYNLMANAWSDSTWITGSNGFEQMLSKMHPDARNAYEKWDPARVDKTLLFKVLVTAYRKNLESEGADKKNLGGTFQKIIQCVDVDTDHIQDHYAFVDSDATQTKVKLDNLSKQLAVEKTRASGPNTGYEYADSGYLAKTIVDCYIFHEILMLHLGTPWIAALPNNDDTRPKVEFALVDALLTIALSRESSEKVGEHDKTFLAKMVGTYPLLCGTPSLWTYWVDFTQPSSVKTKKSSTSAFSAEVNLAKMDSKRIKALVKTMPRHAEKAETELAPIIAFLSKGLASFDEKVNSFARERISAAVPNNPLAGLVKIWLDELSDVGDVSHVKTGIGRRIAPDPLRMYIEEKQHAATKGSYSRHAGAIAKITKEYQGKSKNNSPAESAFLAQEMGIRLLQEGAADVNEVLLLMHRTIEAIVKPGIVKPRFTLLKKGTDGDKTAKIEPLKITPKKIQVHSKLKSTDPAPDSDHENPDDPMKGHKVVTAGPNRIVSERINV